MFSTTRILNVIMLLKSAKPQWTTAANRKSLLHCNLKQAEAESVYVESTKKGG